MLDKLLEVRDEFLTVQINNLQATKKQELIDYHTSVANQYQHILAGLEENYPELFDFPNLKPIIHHWYEDESGKTIATTDTELDTYIDDYSKVTLHHEFCLKITEQLNLNLILDDDWNYVGPVNFAIVQPSGGEFCRCLLEVNQRNMEQFCELIGKLKAAQDYITNREDIAVREQTLEEQYNAKYSRLERFIDDFYGIIRDRNISLLQKYSEDREIESLLPLTVFKFDRQKGFAQYEDKTYFDYEIVYSLSPEFLNYRTKEINLNLIKSLDGKNILVPLETQPTSIAEFWQKIEDIPKMFFADQSILEINIARLNFRLNVATLTASSCFGDYQFQYKDCQIEKVPGMIQIYFEDERELREMQTELADLGIDVAIEEFKITPGECPLHNMCQPKLIKGIKDSQQLQNAAKFLH